MNSANLEQLQGYVRHRLEHELPPGLFYHGFDHTVENVVPAASRLAAGEGIKGESLHLLLSAAWLHDVGFIETRAGHEAVSARIASEVLPGFDYSAEQVQTIKRIIGATVLPQSPQTILEQIMADADLDVLGRDDFMPKNVDLRRELAFFGQVFSDTDWYLQQIKFLEGHTYFTPSAHALRDTGKENNLSDLKHMLAQLDKRP